MKEKIKMAMILPMLMNLQYFTGRADGEEIEAKCKVLYIDSSFGSGTTAYVRFGEGVEEFEKALNPDVEKKTDITGKQTITVKKYEPEASVDPYVAKEGDALYEQLDLIANTYATGASLDTTIVELLVDSDATVVNAYKESVKVVPKSQVLKDGKYQIPFSIYYKKDRVAGTWNEGTKTFTVGSGE